MKVGIRTSTSTILILTFAILVAIFIGASLLGNAANAIDNVHWTGRPLPPCFADAASCGGHILGTDDVGRDELARLIVGARTSLGISLLATVFEFSVLTFLIVTAQRAASARVAITRCAGAVSCFAAWPLILVVASISFDAAPLPRLVMIALLAGVLMGARTVTLSRAPSMTPQLVGTVLRDWALVLLLLATVDFFGLGIQPPTASWGNMLADLQTNLGLAWWAAVFPAVCLFTSALLIALAGRTILPSRQSADINV